MVFSSYYPEDQTVEKYVDTTRLVRLYTPTQNFNFRLGKCEICTRLTNKKMTSNTVNEKSYHLCWSELAEQTSHWKTVNVVC